MMTNVAKRSRPGYGRSEDLGWSLSPYQIWEPPDHPYSLHETITNLIEVVVSSLGLRLYD